MATASKRRPVPMPHGTQSDLANQTGLKQQYISLVEMGTQNGGRELATARWGMPRPPKFLEGKPQ